MTWPDWRDGVKTVLLLGSAPMAAEARHWPHASFDRIVAINNAWRRLPSSRSSGVLRGRPRARLGASSGAVSTGAGAVPCASAAANLSLNIMRGDSVSARTLCALGSESAAIAFFETGGTERAAAATDRLTTCASTAAVFIDG